ncbi:uncharacterized protein LOC125289872 isoform X4 [Alosa alosa]|uniref:uncharacterized protein LOC125289872 isoform X4 n=1 Tax=Alosa alosa TaxID=278164 RepID=UPI0020150A48|nr:uncharacterized protein LOC125289872 isoform X4 [Alosa alosa]
MIQGMARSQAWGSGSPYSRKGYSQWLKHKRSWIQYARISFGRDNNNDNKDNEKRSTEPTAPGSARSEWHNQHNDTGNGTSAGLGGQAAPTQGKDTVNGSSINDHGSSTPGSGTDSKTTNKTNDTKGQSPSGQGENDLQSGQNADGETKQQETDRRILWILLPVLGVLVAGVLFVLKFKCMKVQDHAEPTENGTENASFQRSDSNKDGVMLLGVKTSGGEENSMSQTDRNMAAR